MLIALAAATITAGYLAGAISPAYFLGRWIKGIDIRTVGRGHAGASNVYLHVGPAAGIVTALFDLTKGAAVIAASRYLLAVPPAVAYAGGFAAIAGHVYPFYLQFKGGRGAATATGILLISLGWLLLPDPLFFLPELVLMAFVVVSTVIITRNDYLLSLVVLPLLAYFLLMRYFPRLEAVVAVVIMLYNFLISLVHYLRGRQILLSREENSAFRGSLIMLLLLFMTLLLRPFPRVPFLVPLFALLLFLLLDAVRLKESRREDRSFLRKLADFFYLADGSGRLSAATLILLGATVTMIAFHNALALAAVSFLITGDLAGQLIEPFYGRRRFFAGTLEGTLGHFTACCVTGYILHSYLGLAIATLAAGALAASFVKALPCKSFSKVLIPMVSAMVMLMLAGRQGG